MSNKATIFCLSFQCFFLMSVIIHIKPFTILCKYFAYELRKQFQQDSWLIKGCWLLNSCFLVSHSSIDETAISKVIKEWVEQEILLNLQQLYPKNLYYMCVCIRAYVSINLYYFETIYCLCSSFASLPAFSPFSLFSMALLERNFLPSQFC